MSNVERMCVHLNSALTAPFLKIKFKTIVYLQAFVSFCQTTTMRATIGFIPIHHPFKWERIYGIEWGVRRTNGTIASWSFEQQRWWMLLNGVSSKHIPQYFSSGYDDLPGESQTPARFNIGAKKIVGENCKKQNTSLSFHWINHIQMCIQTQSNAWMNDKYLIFMIVMILWGNIQLCI